jgi:hypothetical protein
MARNRSMPIRALVGLLAAACVFAATSAFAAVELSVPEAGAGAARVDNVFAAAPRQWSMALQSYVAPNLNVTPVVMLLQSQGFAVAAAAPGQAPVLMKEGRAVPAPAAAAAAEKARVDSAALVAQAAEGAAARAGSETASQDQLLDSAAQLHLLQTNGLVGYLTKEQRVRFAAAAADAAARLSAEEASADARVQARMKQIAASLSSSGDAGKLSAETGSVEGARKGTLLKRGPGERAPLKDVASAAAPPAAAPAAEGASLLSRARTFLQWSKYSYVYALQTTLSMNAHRGQYRQALAQDDEYMLFLQNAGMSFGPGLIRAPSIARIFAYYDSQMKSLVERGVVSPDDVLEPVRLYRDGADQLIGLKFGSVVPDGYRVEKDSVLTTKEFMSLIARGQFPIGEPGTSAGVGLRHSMADHDLAHLAAFAAHPEYMAAFRKTLRAAGKDMYSPAQEERLSVATEFLNRLPKENAKAFASLLPEPARAIVAGADVAEMTAVLQALPPGDLVALRGKLLEAHPRLVRHYGGSSNDFAIRSTSHAGHDATLLTPLRAGLERARTREHLAYALARYVVGTYQSSQVEPRQWLEQAAAEKVDRRTRLYKYACGLGLWSSASPMSRAYCR